MMKIAVFGLGYVGAVSCGCLAKLGHTIIGVDVAQAKVDLVNEGRSPLIEPGLDGLLVEAINQGRLRATCDHVEAVLESDVALICVGTPSSPSGGVETRYLEMVCEQIATTLRGSDKPFFTVISRSTSLPYVHQQLMRLLAETSGREFGGGLGYVCHPEFLREGSAVDDFFAPPKIVFGPTDSISREVCEQLYPDLDAETFVVSPEVASMIKYADNAFHATKVAFANEIGTLAKAMNVDGQKVMEVFAADKKLNISSKYLQPGFAFGGSCLPKDVRALNDYGRVVALEVPLLRSLLDSNQQLVRRVAGTLVSPARPKIAMIGLAFKEGTDDVRESPLVSLVELLCGKGMPIKIHDPHLSLAQLTGANRSFALQSIPHLAELLEADLAAIADWAEVLVVAHRLTTEEWHRASLRPDLRILDLVRVPFLEGHPGYEGLHW